jgi:hypothetical protein
VSDGEKIDNNPRAMTAKIDIRRRVLEAMPDRVRVFDAFAGDGHMHAAVWANAFGYVGCDLKYKPLTGGTRCMFAADNRRVMRAIDLAAFNVFDFDAYGSPWPQAIILADRRPVAPGERIGLVITAGHAGIPYMGQVVPAAVSELAGLRKGVAGLARNIDNVVDRCVIGLARRMRCGIARRWQAKGKTGAEVIYTGLVLEGVKPN